EHPQAQAFRAAMDDDFNTAGAVAVLFDLAGQVNRTGDAQAAGLLKALGGVLGLLQHDPAAYLQSPSRYVVGASAKHALSVEEVEALVDERIAAEEAGEFKRADEIRARRRAVGVELEDTPGGVTQWRRA